MPDWLITTYVIALGAIVGSFLNVVIHRLPLDESIVYPASRCPECRTKIKPWDNVPVLSYMLLLGKCRSCRAPISFRYPLVELANGVFYGALWQFTGLSIPFFLLAALISMTIVLIYIDMDIQILPDVIDKPGIVVGLFVGALESGERFPHLVVSHSLLDSMIGAALGWGFLYALARLYKALRGVEGMGQGDMKMLAMIGATLGWAPLVPLVFIASFGGAIFAGILALIKRELSNDALPFGVFLGLATLLVLFFGNTLLAWYAQALL